MTPKEIAQSLTPTQIEALKKAETVFCFTWHDADLCHDYTKIKNSLVKLGLLQFNSYFGYKLSALGLQVRKEFEKGGEAMTIKKIIEEYLKVNGCNGLWNPNKFCGCRIDDLFPCEGCDEETCRAGYAGVDDEGNVIIQEKKPFS